MAMLPNTFAFTVPQGSEWSTVFGAQNADGTPMNILNKTFEFAIRRAVTDTGTPLVSVNSTSSTAQGTIQVNVPAATVQVILSAAATASLVHGGGVYALWMDPGLVDATVMVNGTFYATPVVLP